MAGHSKWANIRFRKAGQDAKRGKLFTKLIREITIAARVGGEDLSSNPRLRAAVDKALSFNMTRDTVNRAVKRGAGGDEGQNLEEIMYEGYGPSGVALMVECMTDNRNRTVSEVRHCLLKHGGKLGTDGSVAYLFSKIGQIIFEPGMDEEAIMDIALDLGADDVVIAEDGSIEVQTQPNVFSDVLEQLKQADLEPAQEEITKIASTEVTLDKASAEKYLKLYEQLEDLEDVQAIYSNADLPKVILKELK